MALPVPGNLSKRRLFRTGLYNVLDETLYHLTLNAFTHTFTHETHLYALLNQKSEKLNFYFFQETGLSGGDSPDMSQKAESPESDEMKKSTNSAAGGNSLKGIINNCI